MRFLDFINALKGLEKTKKQISKEKRYRNAKAVGNSVFKTDNHTRELLLLVGKNAAIIVGIILFVMAIVIDHGGGNSAMCELIGTILLISSAVVLTKQGTSFLEILIVACSGVLAFLLANLLENGVMIRLCGVVVLIIVAMNFFKKIKEKDPE